VNNPERGPRRRRLLAGTAGWLVAGIGDAMAQSPAASAPAAATPQRPVAGQVDFIDGSPMAGAGRQATHPLAVGDTVYQGDRITTDAHAEVHIKLADGGFLAVRPASELVIRRFKADGDADDASVLNLVIGSLRSITGWIAKNNPSHYRIVTTTATIGVRGTDHEPYVIPEGSTLGDPGSYDKVNAGATYVEGVDASGQRRRVDVAPGQAGFFAYGGREAPRVLDRVPALFRPTRNEGRLEGLHERISGQLGELRERRRQQMIERRRGQPPGGGTPAGQRRAESAPQRPPPAAPGQGERQAAAREAREARQKARAEQAARPHGRERTR